MAVPTIDLEATDSMAKRPRKKARPSGSVADEPPSSWGPKPPSEAPPKPPAKKRKDNEITTNLVGNAGDQWMQAKIAEAVDNSGDWHDDNSGDWHDDGNGEANELGFEKSWQMALQQFKVDKAAQLQLALLRDHDWYAASEVVWKLTKKGSYDDDLKNPSGFVNRCCTTAFKNVKW